MHFLKSFLLLAVILACGCASTTRSILPPAPDSVLFDKPAVVSKDDREAAKKKAPPEKGMLRKPDEEERFDLEFFAFTYIGQKAARDDDWDKDRWKSGGALGSAIFTQYGLGIDAGFILSSSSDRSTVDGRIHSDARISVLEWKAGIRYVIPSPDWFNPFIRAGVILAEAGATVEFTDPFIPERTPLYYDSEGAAGLEFGAGFNIAIGYFAMEVALNYSKLRMHFEPRLRDRYWYEYSMWPEEYDMGGMNLGSRPSLYIGLGATF